jgi:hypothetical protein
MWTTFHLQISQITDQYHYKCNPEDEEERNGNNLVMVQLRSQAEGKYFDKVSSLTIALTEHRARKPCA